MTWVVTDRGTVQSLNSAANTTIASFTPGANKLLLLWFAGEANPTAITGHGTWSQIGTSQAWDSGAVKTLRLYACKTSGSPSASTIVLTHSAVWYRESGVVEIDENVAGLPSTVAACFGTPVSMAAYTGVSPPISLGVTLAAFADSTNLTFQVGVGQSGGAVTLTQEAGYTSIHNVGTAEVQGRAAYIASADTSPNMTTTNTSTYVASFAVEIKKAAAIPTPTITTIGGDNSVYNGETSVTVVGTGFGASQGGGKVYLSPTDAVGNGSRVEQTVTAWSDTSITITVVKGGLSLDTNVYGFVVNNGGNSNSSGKVCQINARVFVNETLIGLTGAAVASVSGITLLVWRALPTTGSPNPAEAFTVATNGSGLVNQLITRGSLVINDPIWVAFLKDGSPAKGTLRKITPVYQ